MRGRFQKIKREQKMKGAFKQNWTIPKASWLSSKFQGREEVTGKGQDRGKKGTGHRGGVRERGVRH